MIYKAELARTKVQTHIKRRGFEEQLDVTPHLCQYWWRHLNIALFDNRLTIPVRFECSNYLRTWGWILPWRRNREQRRTRMGIATRLDNRMHFIGVLTHEMVHQWEWEVLQRSWETISDHGPIFVTRAQEIESLLNIEVQ